MNPINSVSKLHELEQQGRIDHFHVEPKYSVTGQWKAEAVVRQGRREWSQEGDWCSTKKGGAQQRSPHGALTYEGRRSTAC